MKETKSAAINVELVSEMSLRRPRLGITPSLFVFLVGGIVSVRVMFVLK